jgi:Tfp pilus assembly protein PilF
VNATQGPVITTDADLDPKYQNLWKKALLSAEQRNWDYVVSLVLPIVKETVTFMDGRMLLRRAEGERAKTAKKGLFGFGGGGGGGMFKGGGKKDPIEQIADLEEGVFQTDPYNPGANQTLYDLAMRSHFPELAAFALETIRQGHPTNTKNMHKLAEHYMSHELPEKAGDTYRAILKVDPRDMAAMKGEKDAAARSSIKNQGWGNEGSFRDKMKNADEASMLEQLDKQGMTKEQMESFLATTIDQYNLDQTNIVIVKRMADLYERLDQLENAKSFYDYALTLNPGDVALQRKCEILHDTIQDRQIAQMETDIEANPDAPDIEEKRAQISEIRRQRMSVVVNEAKARVDRNPTDKQIRFDLGQAYFGAGQYTEAIPELQQAKANPHIRTKAILMLGRCFEKKNMNDLARSAFTEAVKELAIMDNTKKELLYDLALVCEKMGDQAAYLDALKEIYNTDYGYRDVAKRVESSYS